MCASCKCTRPSARLGRPARDLPRSRKSVQPIGRSAKNDAISCYRHCYRPPLRQLNRILGGFYGTSSNDFARRLSLEHHLFTRERIGALPSLRGRLLNDDKLCKTRHEENAVLLQLPVTH